MMARTLPLRLRLTLAFALCMAVVLTALGVFLQVRLGDELLRGIDLDLRARAAAITTTLSRTGAAGISDRDPVLDPDEAFAQVLRPDGTIVRTTSAVRGHPLLPPASLAGIGTGQVRTTRVPGIEDPARLFAATVPTAAGPLVVVVGTNLGDRNEALRRLQWLLLVGGLTALLLSSAAGWVVAGAALRPVERIRQDAAQLSAADPGGRLTVPATGDELARLAETLNDLLRHQQEAMEHERRFVDEASHELRTPLAVVKAELDLALSRPRSRAELLDTVQRASAGTDQLAKLAEDLLVLARNRPGAAELVVAAVPLRTLLEDAAGPGVDVQAPDVTVRVDPIRLRQAVRNLVDNAVRYSTGPIGLSATVSTGQLCVEVTDTGPGLPRSLGDRVFEPFVRGPDAAGPGSGLGLAIVKAVAEAHGGRVEAVNPPGGGAAVSLVVPTASP
jgi:two-component system, OmpR family, sensor kinase